MLSALAAKRSLLKSACQSRNFSFSWPCPRKLREIVKISAFQKENAETCQYIWNEYHHSKPHTVSTVLNAKQYGQLMSRGKASPVFVWPVPKGEAPNHFVLVSKQQDKSFLLTYLGDYQVNPTEANPYMVLTCFDELLESKGIMLLRGDLISHLSEDEGFVLMNQLLDGYLHDTNFETIKKFNHEPDTFDYTEYMNGAIQEFANLKKFHIDTKADKIHLEKVKKYGHKTDAEMNIHKGGIIR